MDRNTIDYEEYYNRNVLNRNFGDNYGKYADSFYEFGSDDEKGGKCVNIQNQNDTQPGPPCDTEAGYFLDKNTMDINTGENPAKSQGSDPDSANAFCDDNQGEPCTGNENIQSELYLINGSGDKKTFIGKENLSSGLLDPEHFALSILQMDGSDTNDDEIMDTWVCADDYSCTGNEEKTKPLASDLIDLQNNFVDRYNDFVPLSPDSVTITNLSFIITPLEDPGKAFAEKDDKIQMQPRVTIILTVAPANTDPGQYFGEILETTFESTVTVKNGI